MLPLLEAISETYLHFDEDRVLLDRSLELSSKELLEYGQRLREAKEEVEEIVKERTRELRYEKAKLDSVAQNITAAAFLFNGDGEVIFVNKTAQEILGYTIGEQEALPALERKFPSIEAPKHIGACLANRESASVPEVEVNGKIYEILFRFIETTDPVKKYSAGLLILIRDITEEKKLDRAKKEFISIASHEMRTPLTIIRGNAELLKEKLDVTPIQIEAMRKMIVSVEANSTKLFRIVNDFLDVSRIEGGYIKFRKEKFNVANLLQDVVSEFKKSAEEGHLSLVLQLPPGELPEAFADRNYSEQIVANLMSNAIHYTEKGGVTVSVERQDPFIKILISDTGVGIEKARQTLLFQKFSTAGRSFTHSKEYGSGLGLYIARILAESMNCKIGLEDSAPGKGSIFSVSFPIAA